MEGGGGGLMGKEGKFHGTTLCVHPWIVTSGFFNIFYTINK